MRLTKSVCVQLSHPEFSRIVVINFLQLTALRSEVVMMMQNNLLLVNIFALRVTHGVSAMR
jgi:hypothetical protein